MVARNEKSPGGVSTRVGWGDTVPSTNFAIGLTEFFFYSLLAAGAVGGVMGANIFEFHADGPASINPISEWRNPLLTFQNMLAEKPLEASTLRNTVVLVGGTLLIWMILRSLLTSGSWVADKARGR